MWLGLWLLAVAAVCVICLVPLDGLPPLPDNSDKVEHLLTYFMLAAGAVQLFSGKRGVAVAPPWAWWRWASASNSRRA